jgi:two-component system osmolarity sensor histidine kinase EnvZ
MSPNKVDLSPERAVRHPFRFLKQFLPRGLFWRSLIIIVTPMILLQGVVSYVFYERHLDTTTRRMARVIAADAAFMATLEDNNPPAERDRLRKLATRTLRYTVEFIPSSGSRNRRRHGAAPSTWR